MDLLAAYRTFQRIAETGSFSAVAREIGATQPAISRQVAALEEHLSTRLIQRSTRRLTLTEDGRELLPHVERVLEAVNESLAAVNRTRGAPSGTVRIGASTTFGRLYLAPRMHRILTLHPDLSIDLHLGDGRLDPIEAGLDLLIHVGEIGDSSLVARRVGSIDRIIVASSAYLSARGEPRSPQDLAGHDCIIFDRARTPREWHFSGPDGETHIQVGGRFSTDNVEAAREAVLTDLGVAVLPTWLVREALDEGRLQPLLGAWKPPRVPLFAIYPSRRHLATRTRAVLDFLLDDFRIDPVVTDYGEA